MATPKERLLSNMRGQELPYWYQSVLKVRRQEIQDAKRKIEESEQKVRQLEKELRFVQNDESERKTTVTELEDFKTARRRISKMVVASEVVNEVIKDVEDWEMISEGNGLQEEEEKEEEKEWKWPLKKEEYERYSRQMIVPGFGLQGQLNIRNARVLIIGAGGLGSPAAAYLAGAGVGTLGLVDGDTVEVSNLHRQIAHSTARVDMKKVDSAIRYLKELNPTIKYEAHSDHLSTENCTKIVGQYDLVLDCTDHPTSRYLISDACVLLKKPLISASALKTSGQLITLNSPPGKGPCYRCVFPKPPAPESLVSCGEGGIIGPVVGTMGVLQALEAVKFISGGGLQGKLPEQNPLGGLKSVTMLLFSGESPLNFRSVKMKGKRENCFACGKDGLTMEQLRTSMDYVQFCGVAAPVNVLTPEERVSPREYSDIAKRGEPHVLLDVREKEHFDMCHMKDAINMPFSKIATLMGSPHNDPLDHFLPGEMTRKGNVPVYFVCQRGNDSQIAARKLKELGVGGGAFVGDLEGGLRRWRDEVEPGMPWV